MLGRKAGEVFLDMLEEIDTANDDLKVLCAGNNEGGRRIGERMEV